MKQIAILSAAAWSGTPSRAQNLAVRMQGHRILYINPPGQKGILEGKKGDIYISTPPAARFFRRRRLTRHIQSALRSAGFEKPVLWVCAPGYMDILRSIPHKSVIYDADIPVKHEISNGAVLARTEEQRASLKNAYLLPDGIDFEMFDEARERNLPFPDDMFNIQNPVIGHMGDVDADTDLAYVAAAANAHPEWSFVFGGRVERGADLSPVKGLKNVRFLGEKEHKLLPVYISRFDVCINISKNENSSPLKLYEYLSSGKPIVSTPHPAQALDYTEVIYLSGTHGEFVACVKKAISERDAWKVRRRIEYGRAASWRARAADFERLMMDLSIL